MTANSTTLLGHLGRVITSFTGGKLVFNEPIIHKPYGLFSGILTANFSVTSTVWTRCPLDTVLIDTESGWSAANNWYVIPRTGYWQIAAGLGAVCQTSGVLSGVSAIISFNDDATTTADILSEAIGNGMAITSNISLTLPTAMVHLTVGDTVRLGGNVSGTGNPAFEGIPAPRIISGMTIKYLGDQ